MTLIKWSDKIDFFQKIFLALIANSTDRNWILYGKSIFFGWTKKDDALKFNYEKNQTGISKSFLITV